MTDLLFPDGLRLERLAKGHARKSFACGQPAVDDWLKTKALQNQEKRLSTTRVLVNESGQIAGFFSLATGQVDFSELPDELTKKLPRRLLPVAVLAWLGIARAHQNRGLGRLLLAQALRDCYETGQTFAFIAVILDCVDDAAKSFYRQFDFAELPGHPYRLFLPFQFLETTVRGQ